MPEPTAGGCGSCTPAPNCAAPGAFGATSGTGAPKPLNFPVGASGKRRRWQALALDQRALRRTVGTPPHDQASQLRSTVPARVAQVSKHHVTFARLAMRGVKEREHAADVRSLVSSMSITILAMITPPIRPHKWPDQAGTTFDKTFL